MSAATDCLSYDPINKVCMEQVAWSCDGCDLYFSEKSLGIPPEILED